MTHNFVIEPSSCPTIKAPQVFQHDAIYQPGEGAGVNTDPALPVPEGSPTHYGGKIIVSGCDPVEFTITYVDYDNCDRFTPNTYVLAERRLRVDPTKLQSIPIPDGWWQNLTYTISGGNGVEGGKPTCVDVYSSCHPAPCCDVFALPTP